MAMTPLTSIASMERYLSQAGIVSFTDHDNDGVPDEGVANDSIQFANGFVVGKLAGRFSGDSLTQSPVIAEIATIIAVRSLCLRRGNPVPDSLEMRYQEIVSPNGLFDQIAIGKIQLIDADGKPIAGRGGYHPTFSNLTVDRRFAAEQIRVEEASSFPLQTRLERDSTPDYQGN